MPHNLDFSIFENIKSIEVNPEGWISPLHIEYAIQSMESSFNGHPSYFWRVKGTLHTFVIPVSRLDYISSGDFKTHFEHALETFREDYIAWKTNNFSTPWSREYRDQFNRFIVV